jgi:hypothetical protein
MNDQPTPSRENTTIHVTLSVPHADFHEVMAAHHAVTGENLADVGFDGPYKYRLTTVRMTLVELAEFSDKIGHLHSENVGAR